MNEKLQHLTNRYVWHFFSQVLIKFSNQTLRHGSQSKIMKDLTVALLCCSEKEPPQYLNKNFKVLNKLRYGGGGGGGGN